MLTHALAVVLRPAHDLGNVGRQTPRVSLFNTFIKNSHVTHGVNVHYMYLLPAAVHFSVDVYGPCSAGERGLFHDAYSCSSVVLRPPAPSW